MLVKSILISTAAALIGPAIGIATFFMAHGNHLGGPATSPTEAAREEPVAELGKAEAMKTFVPQWLHLDPDPILVPERKPQPAGEVIESGGWRTVVRCASGLAIKEGSCPLPEIVPTPTMGEAVADGDPPADAPTSPLPGRMSVGGP